MNTGVISNRYAKAFLKYVQGTGRGEQVCAQVRTFLRDPDMINGTRLEPELERFIQLLVDQGRVEYLRLSLMSFVQMYYKSIGVCMAHLTTAVPAPEIEDKILAVLEKQTGSRVLLRTTVDENLIGGFVLEIDDKMLDASVRSRIEAIRRQFVISTNRIV